MRSLMTKSTLSPMTPGEIEAICHLVDGEAGEVEAVSGGQVCLQATTSSIPLTHRGSIGLL